MNINGKAGWYNVHVNINGKTGRYNVHVNINGKTGRYNVHVNINSNRTVQCTCEYKQQQDGTSILRFSEINVFLFVRCTVNCIACTLYNP